MMKDEIILEERLRAAADHFEQMAAGSEPDMAIGDFAPELVSLLRDAADACECANELRGSGDRGRPGPGPGPDSCRVSAPGGTRGKLSLHWR